LGVEREWTTVAKKRIGGEKGEEVSQNNQRGTKKRNFKTPQKT